MTEVSFYTAESDGGRTLVGLLREALESRTRVLMRVVDERQEEAVSNWLWRQDGFLAHGTRKDGHGGSQLVYVSASMEAPNGARWLLLQDEAPLDWSEAGNFERVSVIVGGDRRPARKMWKAAVAAGLEPKMMERDEGGHWVESRTSKKAQHEEQADGH